MQKALLLAITATSLLPQASRAVEIREAARESLFDNVVEELSERYVDEDFREEMLPKFVALYRDRAARAKTVEQQREVVQQFLSNIPSTHMGLFAADSLERIFDELGGVLAPQFGVELIEYDGKFYAFNVLEQGPAEEAGLRRGDRIVTIDGILTDESPRLEGRTDDAFLPDPPVHSLSGAEGEKMSLWVERTPGKYLTVDVPCKPYSAWEAAKASARIIERDGKRIGHIHFWLIHLTGPDELLKELLEGRFASCDAFILDLRGRGGSGFMIAPMLDVLDGSASNWTKPVVALINGHSRSAKEILAADFRERELGSLVGEHTAGAVIPVSMADVGFGFKLMFPTFTLGEYTTQLEMKGVAPDVFVAEVGPYSAGADPIFEAGVDEAVRLAKTTRPRKRPTPNEAVARARQDKLLSAASGSLPEARPPSSSDESTAAAQDKPGYDDRALIILGKMVDALGGEKAIRQHTSRTIRGIREIGGMIKGSFEELRAAPHSYIRRMDLPGMGKMESGFNGTVGWHQSHHSGCNLLDEADYADMRLSADYYSDLNYKKNHSSIRYVGETKFDGRICHEIRLTRLSGKSNTRYVDAETYLPIGKKGEVKTNHGPMVMTTTIEEFKKFDGEMVPVKYEENVGGMQIMNSTVTDVSFAACAKNAFEAPAEAVASGEK